ncbi:MAG: TIGR01440 family protein [Methylocystaceae bacterium]
MSSPDLQLLTKATSQALDELLAVANLKPEQILVIGCSTSEISGHQIGSASSLEIAGALLECILPRLKNAGVFLAVQGCEHLNRALVVEADCAARYDLEQVTVMPHLRAGGGFATAFYQQCEHPVMVERIAAHAGMDIGDTFIGMHLKRVAVPVRSPIKEIGQAHLTMARTRPPLIGGPRAHYPEG